MTKKARYYFACNRKRTAYYIFKNSTIIQSNIGETDYGCRVGRKVGPPGWRQMWKEVGWEIKQLSFEEARAEAMLFML